MSGNIVNSSGGFYDSLPRCLERVSEMNLKIMTAFLDQARAAQTYWTGVFQYINDFTAPSWTALNTLVTVERNKLGQVFPLETLRDLLGLWDFVMKLGGMGYAGGLKAMNEHQMRLVTAAFTAWLNTVFAREGEDIARFMGKQSQLMQLVVYDYPRAIRAIEPEYGFHFDKKGYIKIAETDRFFLYQVLPLYKEIKVRKKGKPIVIIPPYVLGANIMAFLPSEGRSFVHCFANQGIPTYIRIAKDIDTTPAVQVMTGEDDCLDTRLFCERVKERHGKAVTLCGYCQGGFTAAINLLSGELDSLVDALITCVAPMDGTRSKGMAPFLEQLLERFRDVRYAVKTLPNGNQVVDGELMSWVYKLKNITDENPITAFFRDLKLLEKGLEISKTAAAINYWLHYDITDLPLAISKMSYDSYTIPVTPDGTLPIKLFGRQLNFKRIKEKAIPWLICCAEHDDLVEREAALAPLDWVDAEVTLFPKGHVAIATSWSLPISECSLDRCFLDYRGPVRYQLDLDAT